MPCLCGQSAEELEIIVEKFKELVSSDRKYLVPVLGSLGQFELGEDLKNQIYKVAVEALNIVDENDIPTVLKSLLSALTKQNYLEIFNVIHNSCQCLSDNINSILLDIIGNIFRVNTLSVNLFLEYIDSSDVISKFDIMILIVLISRINARKKTLSLILSKIIKSSITLNILIDTLIVHLILSPYSDSLLLLSQFLLIQSNRHPFLLDWSLSLFKCLFVNYKQCSSQIISNLVTICSTSTSLSNNIFELPNINIKTVDISTIQSSNILYELAKLDNNTVAIYSHLIEELLIYSTNIPIQVLHFVCNTLATLSICKPSILSSLLIYVQKQIFSGNDIYLRNGLVCATYLLENALLSDLDKESILNWVARLISSSNLIPKLLIIDFLNINIKKYDNSLMQRIFSDYILQDLIESVQIYSLYIHSASKKENSSPYFIYNVKANSNGPTKQNQLNVTKLGKEIKGILCKEVPVQLVHSLYLSSLLKLYLNSKRLYIDVGANLVEYIYSYLLPIYELPTNCFNLQFSVENSLDIFLSSLWSLFNALSCNIVLINEFSALIDFEEVHSDVLLNSVIFSLKVHIQLSNQIENYINQMSIYLTSINKSKSNSISNKVQNEKNTIEFCMNQLPKLDYSVVLFVLNHISISSDDFTDISLVIYNILYKLCRSNIEIKLQSNTLLFQYMGISNKIKTPFYLDNLFVNYSKINSYSLLLSSSSDLILHLTNKNLLSKIISHSTMLLQTLTQYSISQNTLDISQIPLLQNILHLILLQYLTLDIIVAFSRESSNLLLNKTLAYLALEITGKQSNDIKSNSEIIFDYFQDLLLKTVDDFSVTIVILDILSTLTRGLKKSSQLVSLFSHCLQKSYNSNVSNILQNLVLDHNTTIDSSSSSSNNILLFKYLIFASSNLVSPNTLLPFMHDILNNCLMLYDSASSLTSSISVNTLNEIILSILSVLSTLFINFNIILNDMTLLDLLINLVLLLLNIVDRDSPHQYLNQSSFNTIVKFNLDFIQRISSSSENLIINTNLINILKNIKCIMSKNKIRAKKEVTYNIRNLLTLCA